MITEISPPTQIAEATRVSGVLNFFATAQIFGIVDGDLIQQSLEPIQVGKCGWVNGTIISHGPVLIEGRVEGTITSKTKIRLLPTANVRGRLTAPSIEIRAGALFDGELVMEKIASTIPLRRAA